MEHTILTLKIEKSTLTTENSTLNKKNLELKGTIATQDKTIKENNQLMKFFAQKFPDFDEFKSQHSYTS